jgi:hypothetical protein
MVSWPFRQFPPRAYGRTARIVIANLKSFTGDGAAGLNLFAQIQRRRSSVLKQFGIYSHF